MIRLAVLGDRHVSSRSPRYQVALDAWAWAVEDAITHGATAFVGLGDVCEGDPTGVERMALGARYQRMRAIGPVLEVLGNHEHRDALRWLEFLGVHVAWNAFTFDILGAEVGVLSCPYPRRGHAPYDGGETPTSIAASMGRAIATMRDAVEKARGATGSGGPLLIAGHWAVAGMRVGDSDFELHATHEPIFPVDVFTDVALVVTGHVHKAQEIAPNIVGVGSLYRTSFGEASDTPSYTLVTVDGGRVTWERRPVPCPEMAVYEGEWGATGWVGENFSDGNAGKEIKVTLRIHEDAVATAPTPDELRRLLGAEDAALFVVEREIVSAQRTRAPALTPQQAPGGQLAAWLDAVGLDVDAERRARLVAKVEEIEG